MNEQITNLIYEIEHNYDYPSFSEIDSYLNIKIMEVILKSSLTNCEKESIIQSYAMYEITAIEALESCYTLN